MYEFVFHPETDKDLSESYNWYEDQKEGLGEELLNKIEGTLGKIKNNPLHYQLRTKAIREALTDTFPFAICYKINKNRQIIYIVAIFHTSRNPKQKLKRKFQ